MVPQGPKPIGQHHRRLVAKSAIGLIDEFSESLLIHHLIDELVGDLLDDFTPTGIRPVVVPTISPSMRTTMAAWSSSSPESKAIRTSSGFEKIMPSPREPGRLARHVIATQDDVLCRPDNWAPCRRAQDVVRGHHQNPSFDLRLYGKRDVDRHLIAVEIGVECRTHQGMKLNGLALDQHRFKRLHPESVQSGRAIQKDGVLLDDFRQDVPHLRSLVFHHLTGCLDGGHKPSLLELRIDKRLEQFEGHAVRKSALVQSQLGPNNDHRAP